MQLSLPEEKLLELDPQTKSSKDIKGEKKNAEHVNSVPQEVVATAMEAVMDALTIPEGQKRTLERDSNQQCKRDKATILASRSSTVKCYNCPQI